ncbi:hypothetical protein [Halorubrum lacusprofundi]|uniref:Uncharacterized protein n=1 Tax=Halorubrum lacusprofundi (strain ATCC 49239 / DSM 5036 / JCM 8891 / ACAM 34) TaxID=416348 RepID=B9LQ19_HALLT|nr:hypothetical protein [Halorubrum lacusprofundi]ACM57457.1 hypothetical protein Hlac_1879 [Halorubrum lacusprofundi ATCC 49239]MCG1005945.1 hypothetical protein [Halorubrum lacusprofundi]
MQRTRRGLLGVGAAAVVGLSGCLGVEGVEYPDAAAEDPPNADGGDDGGGDGETAGDEQVDGDDPEPVANEALATATRNVVDDAVWFATEYPSAVATYRDAIREVVAEIDDVRDAVDENDAVTVEMADRLDEAGRTAADTAADALEPQFHPRFRIVSRTERHVEKLRTFAPRGDVDRFLEELSRMRRGFAAVGTATYVDEAFSREPIHNRLLNRLLYPLPDDDAERRRVRGEAFVELGLASRGFSAFAHEPYDDEEHDRNQIPRIYGNAFEAARREELRARLGPIPRSEDRTEELFVAFATRPAAGNRPSRTFEGWAHELEGVPLYVQRYPDASTANDRLDEAVAAASTEGRAPIDPDATAAGSDFSGDATGEGGSEGGGESGSDEGDGEDGEDQAPIYQGPTRWHRLYHHEAEGERYGFGEHAGVQYGYVVQAGEFVVAAGFSGDAWEERTGWQGQLANGWAVV